MELVKSVWFQLSARSRWILTGSVVLVLIIGIVMLKLHNMEAEAEQLRMQLREALAKQKINEIQGNIKAEAVKQKQNQALIDLLNKQVVQHKTDLEKQYKEKGLSSDEIANRFKSIGLT